MTKDLDFKTLKIIPFKSVGPIPFNLSVEEVLEMLGEPTQKFMRNIFSKRETLLYSEIGVFMGFDKNLKLDSMEFVEPANLVLFDKELFKLSFDDLIELFKEKDPSTTEDDDGFIANNTGIAAYVPIKEECHKIPVEGILVYRDLDYYQQVDE